MDTGYNTLLENPKALRLCCMVLYYPHALEFKHSVRTDGCFQFFSINSSYKNLEQKSFPTYLIIFLDKFLALDG